MVINVNSICWMWHRSIIIIYLISYAYSVEIIPYKFHSDNDESINKCVQRAMEIISDQTCLLFEPATDFADRNMEPILFMQSPFCLWRKSNQTMHLNGKCLNELSPPLPSLTLSSSFSLWSDDACLAVLSHALSVTDSSLPIRTQVIHLINTMYNCTERCNIECENGGKVKNDCSCQCAYGFEGKNCEELSRRKLFTDSSCGIHNDEQGTVSLSTYPEARTGATFCQWLIKSMPEKTIEFYIKDLDLDDDNVPPDQPCNDIFYVWGAKSIANPILCVTRENLIGIRFESDSNWLLIELRTNPWSERSHRGPRIKYRQVDAPYQRSLRAFTTDVITSNASSNVPISIILLLVTMIK
uniref:EGF-like domain-containing protein n=2 Tax=Wuchereria bancrofti TaxID=6293 RepID=A0AAF5PQQ1_WUCBA